MQRGWLLLGLGLVWLVLFAVPARLVKADEPGGEVKPHGSSSKLDRELEKSTEEESNIFKGWLDLGIWTIVVFLLLLFVLRRFAWKPMMEGLENREKHIHDELASAQKANADAQALKAEFEKRMAEAQQEVRELIEQARKNGEQVKADMISQATAEIQAERARLIHELDNLRDQAQLELFQRSTQLATLVAAKAIKRQVNLDDQHRLVDDALADLGVAASDRQRVLASVT
jgi:F-type H+-transporting ATPase subunit b